MEGPIHPGKVFSIEKFIQGGNKTVLASDISFDQLLSIVGLKFTFPLFQTQSNRESCFLDRKTAFILAR